jgi:hypothetical protein
MNRLMDLNVIKSVVLAIVTGCDVVLLNRPRACPEIHNTQIFILDKGDTKYYT